MNKKINFSKFADKALQGLTLTKKECLDILNCPEGKIRELLQAGFFVRKRYFGKEVYLHMLINAKSGHCTENCSYCSQSAVSKASIEKYPLLDEETIVEGAYAASEA